MSELKPVFFVACTARSGSQWLASLLDRVLRVRVLHANNLVPTPLPGDVQYMIDSYYGRDVQPYLTASRNNLACKLSEPGLTGWGEVSQFHRYSVPHLRALFDVPVVGLIRSGPLTVRSLLRKGWYSRPGYTSAIEPRGSDLLADWAGHTPFEKTCWFWADTYRRLLRQDVPIFRLEDLDRDFDFLTDLLDIPGLTVEYTDWQDFAGHPMDPMFSPWPMAWTRGQIDTFEHIAGDIQETFYGS